MVSKKNSGGTDVGREFQCVLTRPTPQPVGAGRIPGLTPVMQQPHLQGTGHMPAYLRPTKLDKN